MEFKINPAVMGSMFALPTVITDENLKLASATQIKAVLYLFRHQMMGENVTCQEIADATGYDREDIVDAMIFWQERGVVNKDGEQTLTLTAIKQEPKAEPEKKEENVQREEKFVEVIPVTKPTHEQIAARCEECEEFRLLFEEAHLKLNKTIGYDGQATLIMLHDSYGLPIEVILMLIEYAKMKGKTGFSYLSNLGRIWAENEIDTLESAEAYIEEQTGVDALWKEFRTLTGVKNQNPTTKQRQYLSVWKKEYGFDMNMIYKAYEISVDNTEKMSFPYMEKVLKNWHDSGVKTPMDAQREKESFKAKKAEGKSAASTKVNNESSSYDLDAFAKRSLGLKYSK